MTTTDHSTVPIRGADRVSDVLARSEALVDVFVRCSPYFSKLRSPSMRRVMARLVTVDQAARMARVSAEQLVADLNAALGVTESADGTGHRSPPASGLSTRAPATHPAHAHAVELDLREELRAGREPFSTIMDAVGGLRDNDLLLLRTIFEPVPLLAVLAKRGFLHETVAHADDDWTTWFWRPAGGSAAEASPAAAVPPIAAAIPGAGAAPDGTLWLDVRGLNPPEPLLRTLAALETLPPDHELVQVNSRVPQLLFPMLAERGFACKVDDAGDNGVLVRIWRAQ